MVDKAFNSLSENEKHIALNQNLKNSLCRGIAAHHSEITYVMRDVIEKLFARGLIKVLLATETFAMGVNMPAKSVIFLGVTKSDGKSFRLFNSSEYT